VFTLNVRLRSFSDEERSGFPRATPALLMRIVGGPRVVVIFSAAEAIEEGDERSQVMWVTVGGAVGISNFFLHEKGYTTWKSLPS
jgi:hypothetical protein